MASRLPTFGSQPERYVRDASALQIGVYENADDRILRAGDGRRETTAIPATATENADWFVARHLYRLLCHSTFGIARCGAPSVFSNGGQHT